MSNEKYFVQLGVPKYGENSLIPVIRDGHVMFELSIESDTERTRRILSLEQLEGLRDSIERAISSYSEAQSKRLQDRKKTPSLPTLMDKDLLGSVLERSKSKNGRKSN